jgi:transposase
MNAIDNTDEPRFAAFAALDWGDSRHAWSLQPAGSGQTEQGEIEHTPEAVQAWATELSRRFGGQPVAIAVEQSRGPLVFMLGQYSHLHIYPVHPRAASQFRAALFPSGAKDDPADSKLLLELLLHHRPHLRRLNPDTPETRRVQHLVEARRKLVNEKTRQSNRLTAQMKLYFPQMLDWFSDIASTLATDLLRRWPTLEALQRARPTTLRSFFTTHNCRSQELIDRRLDGIRHAVPALNDAPLMESAVAITAVLIGLIEALRDGIAGLDRQIARAAEAHPDFAIFDSFPGAGPVLAPRLLAAFGAQRQRYRSAAELQTYSGIAPVTERSGKTCWVHSRWACPRSLRQTFHEWAAHSIGFCDWAAAFYRLQRDRGKDHHAAVRALAFKWIRIAFRCWQDGVTYDNTRYLFSLHRRHSPLVAILDHPTPSS